MIPEQEDNFRLRKAVEFLAHCREQENVIRSALALATATTKRAKEKHETLFMEVEARSAARRRKELNQINAA